MKKLKPEDDDIKLHEMNKKTELMEQEEVGYYLNMFYIFRF